MNKRVLSYVVMAALVVAAVFTSCERYDDIINCGGSKVDVCVSVYVAGYVKGEFGKSVATLWKNGVPQSLTDGKYNAGANSVCVSGNDVYVVGYERNATVSVAKLWKNGIAQNLTDGTHAANAHSVCVSGSDVYVVGYDNNRTVAKLWKNGVETNLTDGTKEAEAYSVCVSGNDVYVVGYEDYKVARLWKNGVIQNLDGMTFVYSVCVSGNDVYVAGMSGGDACGSNGCGLFYPALWKNGVVKNLSSAGSNWTNFYFVYLSGMNVYVAGSNKLWKNGTEQNLSGISQANSIFVSDNDVYVVGLENNYPNYTAKLWRNNILQNLTDNTESSANSVFVVKRNK